MLDDQLYQNWLLQLQTWAACGRLFSAGVAALRLKSGNTTDQLKRIAHRLAKGKIRDLPPIELLPRRAMAGAMGAYASATGTIYLNKHWLNHASNAAFQAVLTEEFGHHLDQLLSKKDTYGDEGEVFAGLLIDPEFDFTNRRDYTKAGNDQIKILVKGK